MYYFCNVNILLKRTHLGMVKKMKGDEGKVWGEKKKRNGLLEAEPKGWNTKSGPVETSWL